METSEAATDNGDTAKTPLEVYEWGGAIVAGLGFFMTPLLTGLPAIYCAVKVREHKPLASIGILLVLLATVLFWAGFVFGEQLTEVLFAGVTATGVALLLFGLVLILLPIVVFLVVVYLRR